jgi:hypothetical protein
MLPTHGTHAQGVVIAAARTTHRLLAAVHPHHAASSVIAIDPELKFRVLCGASRHRVSKLASAGASALELANEAQQLRQLGKVGLAAATHQAMIAVHPQGVPSPS